MQESMAGNAARHLHGADIGASSSLNSVQPQASGLGSIQAHSTGAPSPKTHLVPVCLACAYEQNQACNITSKLR